MNILFPVEPVYPNGFRYEPDFIDVEEEQILLREIANLQLDVFHFQGYEAKRRTANFGYDWNFERRQLSKGKTIPSQFDWLVRRASEKFLTPREAIAELLVTEYPPGAVINWHRDAPPFDTIIGISLLSDCVFKLKPHDKTKQSRHQPYRCRLSVDRCT